VDQKEVADLGRRSEKIPLRDSLPTAIVPELARMGRALCAVVRSHRGSTLARLEQETVRAIREAMSGLPAAVIQARTTSLQLGGVGRTRPCPTCAQRCPVQSWRRRTPTTIRGPITIERPW
jgi:hypothetical protein